MKKLTLHAEMAYLLGNIFLSLGATLMEKSDFGVSMVIAPAYLLFKAINPYLSFFTFGTACYVFQAVLLVITCLVIKKFKVGFLFSFATAVIYGLMLDGFMLIFNSVALTAFLPKTLFYVLGLLLSSAGVAMMFHTYLAPEVYELFVKEFSRKFNKNIHKVKTVYDCSSCVFAIILSFVFFGFGTFVGVKLGTVLCAIINGLVISLFSKFYDKIFQVKDLFPLRKYFTD